MNTEETKDRKNKVGCNDFGSDFRGFKEMFEKMSECCMGQDRSIDCGAMMKAMMDKWCGPRADDTKSDQ